MSRSGYSDDLDNWSMIKWRGAVQSAIKGKRGQQLLREIAAALDAMPVKELIAHDFEADGSYCTLGVVGCARGLDMSGLDPEDYHAVAETFGIARALAQEIVYENDEYLCEWEWVEVEICGPMREHYPDWGRHTRGFSVPAKDVAARRWHHMRTWVASHLKAEGAPND